MTNFDDVAHSAPSTNTGVLDKAQIDEMLEQMYARAREQQAKEEEERRNLEKGVVILPPILNEPLTTADASTLTPEQAEYVRGIYKRWWKTHPTFHYGGSVIMSPEFYHKQRVMLARWRRKDKVRKRERRQRRAAQRRHQRGLR
jgi:hypothetical protein